MLENPTVEGLKALRLDAMAAGLIEQRNHPDYLGLAFEDRLGLLIDRELTDRSNRRIARCLKSAKLRSTAVVEDIDFHTPRGLSKPAILALSKCDWVERHHTVTIVGATGVGKTYLASALANAAIRHGHTTLYLRSPRMLDDLAIARADGRLARLMATWARISLLVIDDFLVRPLNPDQAADLLEVIDDRAGLRSTIVTSQLPIAHWHEAMGDDTIADAVLDRLLENAHRIELAGESLRRSGTADPVTKPAAVTAGNTSQTKASTRRPKP